MGRKLWLLIRKNIQLLVRAKWSALVIVIAPLLLVLFLGLSYDSTQSYRLTVGTYASEMTPMHTQLFESLRSQGFELIEFDSLENCQQGISDASLHACLQLPNSFEVQDNQQQEVIIYVDESRITLAWIIQQSLQEELSIQTQELSEELLSDLLSRIQFAITQISSQQTTIQNVQDQLGSIQGSVAQIAGISAISYNTNFATINNVSALLEDSLENASSELSVANSALSSLNISSSQRSTVSVPLVAGDSQVDVALNTVKGSGENTFSQLREIMISLDTALVDANEKITQATTSASSASDSAQISQEELAVMLSSLQEVESQLSGFAVTDAGTLARPLHSTVTALSSEGSTFHFLFPSILVLITMFISILLGTTIVLMEKSSHAYIRNTIVPVKKTVHVLANFLSTIILVAIQLFVVLVIALLFIQDSWAVFPLLFLVLLLATAIFSLCGMVVGYAFNSEETGVLAAVSLGSLFLFLSGVVVPIEGMVVGLQQLAALNPFVLTENIIRELFIFGNSVAGIVSELFILSLYVIVLFLCILVLDSIMHKHVLQKLLYRRHKKRQLQKLQSQKLFQKTLANSSAAFATPRKRFFSSFVKKARQPYSSVNTPADFSGESSGDVVQEELEAALGRGKKR